MFQLLGTPEQMLVLDDCKVSSANIILTLRLHTLGLVEKAHTLYIKPFGFAATDMSHLKVTPSLKTWGAFTDAVYKHKESQPIVGL